MTSPVIAVPNRAIYILVGSEDPECDPKEWVDDEDYNREFTEQWTHQAYRYAQRVHRISKFPTKSKGVVDLYDVSEDWIPIYDKSHGAGLLHGHWLERQSVQERADRRQDDGVAHRLL